MKPNDGLISVADSPSPGGLPLRDTQSGLEEDP